MTVQKPIVKSKDAPDLGVFSWSDPFYLELQLSEEERMLKDASKTFAQEKLQPRVTKAFQNETIELEKGDMYVVPKGIQHKPYAEEECKICLLYTSPSPRDGLLSRMPSSA